MTTKTVSSRPDHSAARGGHPARFSLAVTLALLLTFAACGSGGGGGAGLRVGGACDQANGGAGFCLSQCNLGCTSTGCNISEIAVNQPIILTFNQTIDPRTVTPAAISMKTASGREPVGEYLVQGEVIYFLPEVRTIGGATFFGFDQGETYALTLPGGPTALSPLRSNSGDPLARSVTCFLRVSRGVVDMDGKPPEAALLTPSSPVNVANDTEIVVQFSELIDEAPFQGAGPANGPVTFQVLPTDAQGNCGTRTLTLDGQMFLVTDKFQQKTILRFRPAGLLPGKVCVRVEVTSKVHDLSNKPAVARRFEFRTKEVPVLDDLREEDFTTTAKLDSAASGAFWGNGAVVPGIIGGTGKHGPFTAKDGVFVSEDSGITTYRWSTDSQLIPKLRTLSNQDETITDGVFEFSTFAVARSERVLWVGAKPAMIFVRGRVDLQGEVLVNGANAAALWNGTLPLGQPGAAGGPGGGKGGAGANNVLSNPGKINGDHGQDAVVLPGSPYSAAVPGTGGRGSLGHPQTAPNGVTYSLFSVFSGQLAAGGGGGSLYNTTGTKGEVTHFLASSPGDKGPDAPPGTPLFQPPVTPSVRSSLQFLIGGAGGGGAGINPYFSVQTQPPNKWSSGAGGAGGGGAILLRAGGSFNISPGGRILSRGGSCFETVKNISAPSPGGGGSGGSVLLQSGALSLPVLTGVIDVTGGKGGFVHDPSVNQPNGYRSIGGDGGPGYVRVEAARQTLRITDLGTVIPAADTNNIGTLDETNDLDLITGVQSIWYSTDRLFPPEYVRYEIETLIDGSPRVFSDDPTKGEQPRLTTTPIAFFLQCAQVNTRLEPDPFTISDWLTTTNELNLQRGNGFRFVLLLDRAILGPATTLEVKKVRVLFRG